MDLFRICVFPGVLFLVTAAFLAEYVDRKLYARLQNRVGPPIYQPLADFIKLVAKEDFIPRDADRAVFRWMPLVSLATSVCAFFYIPLWSKKPFLSFTGDSVVVLYLLTVPTFTFFLAGLYSRSIYSMIGAVRALSQLFAYEVPLFLAILAPAILADSWSLAEISSFYAAHPLYTLLHLPALGISLIALLGKLEKAPFDIPEAETEIVAGSFTEYSGRRLAFFKMALDVELVVCASLIAAVFMPFGLDAPVWGVSFVVYLVKTFLVVAMLSVLRTILARFRLDQMINFCWRFVAPVAFAQVILDVLIKFMVQR